MQVASSRYLVFLWTVGLLVLAQTTTIMNSLDSSFTIEVNGAPIAKVGDDAEDRVQATTGGEAATFTLSDGRLKCGEWTLGRSITEDRSFLPKQVFWFKEGETPAKMIQPVTAHKDGDKHVVKFGDAPLITEDGKLFADIQGDAESDVIVKTQS